MPRKLLIFFSIISGLFFLVIFLVKHCLLECGTTGFSESVNCVHVVSTESINEIIFLNIH